MIIFIVGKRSQKSAHQFECVSARQCKIDHGQVQRWGTFLRKHAPHIAAMDLFVVPTINFIQLYVVVIVRLARRELVWINITRHPTAEWIARQITEAFPWNEAPRYLIRDRDAIYGAAVTHRGAPLVRKNVSRFRLAKKSQSATIDRQAPAVLMLPLACGDLHTSR